MFSGSTSLNYNRSLIMIYKFQFRHVLIFTLLICLYEISFSATGEIKIHFTGKNVKTNDPVQIDAIQIKNLSRNRDTTLFGITNFEILDVTDVDNNIKSSPEEFTLSPLFANPFYAQTNFSITVQNPTELHISIFNVLGQSVLSYDEKFIPGEHHFSFHGGNLQQGIYFLRVAGESKATVLKMLKLGASNHSTAFLSYKGIATSTLQSNKTLNKIISGDTYRFIGFANGYKPDTIIVRPMNDTTYSFNFIPLYNLETIMDIDGNIYHTVTIGSQVWMVENLRVTRYRNGDTIPNISNVSGWANNGNANKTGIGAYCNYNNDTNNVAMYGRLYNFFAVSEDRSIAPAGWHVPGDDEWQTLIDYLGGDFIAGGKMKEAGIVHWNYPNVGATNESGFTALPAGIRTNEGAFVNIGKSTIFWSNLQFHSYTAFDRALTYDYAGVYYDNDFKRCGLSIRCVKD